MARRARTPVMMLSAFIPADLFARLDAAVARRQGRGKRTNRSKLVRQILRAAMDQDEEDAKEEK